MASFLLVIAIGAMGMIIFWYVFDEAARGGTGTSGFLGMVDRNKPSGEASAPSWKNNGRRPWRVGRRR